MINLPDSVLLAATKLKTRRIRTTVTVAVSGLLFACLIASLIVVQGADQSIQSFSKEGLNSRYIVSVAPDPPISAGMMQSASVQARAQQIYDQTIADKKAEAKKLGVDYDPSTEVKPTTSFPMVVGQQPKTLLNLGSPAALQALNEYVTAHPGPGLDQLKQIADPYHPTGIYENNAGGVGEGTLKTMPGGAEEFQALDQSSDSQQKDLLQNASFEAVSPKLTKPFLLLSQPKTYDSGAVPLVISYSKAEKLLGLAALPKSAPADQKLARIRELYAKAGSIEFSACYRNSVSGQQIESAISQANEIATNKGNKSYQKPNLIYGLPSQDSCSAATVLSDTRTSSDKKLASNQAEFTKAFGGVVDPVQTKLKFRVVGLTPDQSSGSNTTIGGILQSIVGSSLDGNLDIPSDMLDAMPNASQVKSVLFPKSTNPLGFSATTYYVEFGNANDARHFIDDKSCTTRSDGRCATATKPFDLEAYGSNSIALQDLRHKYVHYFKLASAAVVVVAVFIMSGTIGRMIADGRRETAVFRAIGAKRFDISCIYAIYTLGLALLVAAFSLIGGIVAAKAVDHRMWQSATAQAQLLFGATESSRQFHFYAVNTKAIFLVLLAAVLSGLVSMLIPLVRNARRNPIRDMRDE